jgi:hypothetical protein
MARPPIARSTGWLSLLAALAACYALPERHSVSRETSEQDPDAEVEGDADGGFAMDAAVDGGKRDAALDDGRAPDCDCRDPAKPVCIEATKTCVACSADDRGACTDDQLCDVLQGACVECLQNTDCKDPKRSVCDSATHACKPCAEASASDCSHIAGKQVCLVDECVQCTKDKLTACVVQQASKSVQNACSALNHTCTTRELGKTLPCAQCVSDAECIAGHACVGMEFGGQPIEGKWYCLPVLKALNCNGEQPYGVLATGKITVEGTARDVCTLRGSTCEALNDYIKQYCGLDQNDQPVALNDAGMPVEPSVKGDNSRCGLPGLDDGYCIEAQPGLHRCTLPCTQLGDCPKSAPACMVQTHAAGTEEVCKVL